MKNILRLLLVISFSASFAGCTEKTDEYCIKKCPVSAYIDGTKYSSNEYKHFHDRQQSTIFEQKGVLGFHFKTKRTIFSESGDSACIQIHIDEDSAFNTGIKYPLPKDGDGKFRNGNDAYLTKYKSSEYTFPGSKFKASDGWIEFTKYEEKKDGIYLSGRYEYTATWTEEIFSKVTKGSFKNIVANY